MFTRVYTYNKILKISQKILSRVNISFELISCNISLSKITSITPDLTHSLKKMTLNPKESGEIIAKLATHVKIKDEGIEKLGKELISELKSGRLSPECFSQNDIHPKCTEPWAVDWIFVVDSINFCFWKPELETGWQVDGQTGYFALCAAINRAMKERIEILDPKYYSKITEEQLKHVLRSDTSVTIPLLPERVKCLQEVGITLLEKFDGSFVNCVKNSDHSATKLLKIVTDNFPCFRDEAVYKGHKVSIYKRAQILIGDIWACFRNKDLGNFTEMDQITMFADYRVPQSLIFYGVLEYTSELNDLLKKKTMLENGDEMEVEIRGCSIHAVELLKKYVKENSEYSDINSIVIDHFLWDFRRKYATKILNMGIPFHKTLCIYY